MFKWSNNQYGPNYSLNDNICLNWKNNKVAEIREKKWGGIFLDEEDSHGSRWVKYEWHSALFVCSWGLITP